MFASLAAQAGNILVNPGFEADGGHSGSSGTAGWTANGGNCWIEINPPVAHSGNNYYKVWGAFNGSPNIQALWQDKPCLPTAVFQADGWVYTLSTDNVWSGDGANLAWIEVSFRDAGNNILALYKSESFNVTNYSPDIWYDLPVTNVCETSPPYGIIGTTNQLVAPAGTTYARYQHNLSQVLWGGGSTFLDDATLNQVSGPVPPAISSVYPGNMLQASNHISFNVTSPSSTPINNSGIQLVVNGTDVSGSLTITGTASSKSVLYTGLTPNTFPYTASIFVTDAVGLTASTTMNFDTIHASYLWEAEDYDFTSGHYLNHPILSSTPQSESYFGTVGVSNVDYGKVGTSGGHVYRSGDPTGTGASGDYARQNFLDAQVTNPAIIDYTVGYIAVNDWLNYTRDYPTGTFNIYARLAGGSGATTLSLDDVTTPGVTNNLGIFAFSGSDWGAYQYVPLVDTNGNLLPFPFNGHRILRTTLTSGGENQNFFMLVPAQTGLPFLSNISPANGTRFASGNTFSFTADSASGINASGIHLFLNGADVTSSLAISGSANTKNVSCALLSANNPSYTVVIAVTNTAGSGVTRTVQFDTMSTDNFYVKIQDFDHDGGQWDTVNNGLLPNGYIGQNNNIINCDYYHSATGGGAFPYRGPDALATEVTADVPLPGFTVGTDYDVGNFNSGDWGNYTRNYPAGKYLVYGRLAGYSLTAYLDKVTSGWGSTNQTTQRLGTWKANPNGWQNWAWVPLTDSGLVAPVIVTVEGTNTLRVTSGGNANANYFMLVAAQGIRLSAAKSGSNIVISFPTQAGASYRVFYNTSLTSGTWTLLTTVPGDGTVKSVSDPATGSQQYYKVTSP